MSDRIKGFHVVLKENVKDDDFENIKTAVLMIKGILDIVENNVDIDDLINRNRIRHEMVNSIIDVITKE